MRGFMSAATLYLKGYVKQSPGTLHNLLRSSGYLMYHKVRRSEILRSAHRMYFRFLCGSRKKRDYFPINY